jgi:hypothetical protein
MMIYPFKLIFKSNMNTNIHIYTKMDTDIWTFASILKHKFPEVVEHRPRRMELAMKSRSWVSS